MNSIPERTMKEIEGMFDQSGKHPNSIYFRTKYPNFKWIWKRCRKLMHIAATKKRKGNSWLELKPYNNPNSEFWLEKMREERSEVDDLHRTALDVGLTTEEKQREIDELCDEINCCAMRIDLLRKEVDNEKRQS